MAHIRWPWCENCGEPEPRSGRSRYCDNCRRENRRTAQNQAQRNRRAAARIDPDTARLLDEVTEAAAELDAYLKAALTRATMRGGELNKQQKQAFRLVASANDLAAQIRKRGLRPQPDRQTPASPARR